ncbi:MoaD/ThiS family protein [Pandoraea pnomenusa]|uniref:MoaD/ThiS family protein n=1 Tax=Pandoraea pnomenusa TaxID=93220 RepID=UPI00333E76F5
MSIKIQVPALLRALTRDEKQIAAQGNSVREVIEHAESQFPGIKARLLDGDQMRKFINVYVNDQDIRFAKSLDTPVQTGDVITILPAVAGGSSVGGNRHHAANQA